MRRHYPKWNISYSLDLILEEMVTAEQSLVSG